MDRANGWGPTVPQAGGRIDTFVKKEIALTMCCVPLGWGRALLRSRASSSKAAPTRMGGVEEELARRRPIGRPAVG